LQCWTAGKKKILPAIEQCNMARKKKKNGVWLKMTIKLEKIAMENFESRMGRTIDKEMLVGVHWNAHKKIWSIVQMKSRHSVGLVLGYASEVTLRDVTTHIDKSKQKKVLESPTQAKDRHAFIVGYIEDLKFESLEKNIYYKPQCVKDFVDAEAWFKHGEKKFIENVSRASLKWNHEKNHPVVKYNA
jgi:hypothetical protein